MNSCFLPFLVCPYAMSMFCRISKALSSLSSDRDFFRRNKNLNFEFLYSLNCDGTRMSTEKIDLTNFSHPHIFLDYCCELANAHTILIDPP